MRLRLDLDIPGLTVDDARALVVAADFVLDDEPITAENVRASHVLELFFHGQLPPDMEQTIMTDEMSDW